MPASLRVVPQMEQGVKIINPIEYASWDKLLLASPGYSFFHSSNWARVLSESYGYKPLYFAIFEEGRLAASLPVMEIKSFFTGSRGVSLPFSDYCGPIIASGDNYHGLLDRLLAYGGEASWKYVEIRCRGGSPMDLPPSSQYFGHTLNLSTDNEKTFSRLRDSTKRNIRKAIRDGVKVSISDSFESIRRFYRLNCITRKRHGLPPQPYHFFKSIHGHIISKNLGFIALAEHEKRTIAGALYLHLGKKAHYKYGASDPAYQHTRANNLVTWEAIKWYAEKGFQSLCFGRTEPENTGLRRFKSGWGAEESIINYYKYDLAKKAFIQGGHAVSGVHNKFLRNMPMPLLRLLGTVLYRHTG